MVVAGAVRLGKAYLELMAKDKTGAVLNQVTKKFNNFGRKMKSLGQSMMGLSAASLLPIGLSVKTYASFSDAILTLKGVTKGTQQEFKALTDQAKELGRTTSFTAEEVASLQVALGRGGMSRPEIKDATASVLDLARATGTDAAMAAGIAIASLRQFGLEASETSRVADVLTATANSSFNTLEDIGEAMKYAGPVAADFNASIEETAAVVGILGNVGIQGTLAGTAMRRMYIEATTGAGAFKEFGVEVADADNNLRPMIEILADTSEALTNMGSQERGAAMEKLFGARGITSASAIGKAAKSARLLQQELNNSSGAAKRTAETMDSGLGGAMRRTWSAIEGMAIAVGESLEDNLIKKMDYVITAAGMVTVWINANQQLVIAITSSLGAIGALGAALVGLAGIMKFVSIITSTLSAIVAIISSPIFLIVAAIAFVIAAVAALGAGILYLVGAFEGLNPIIKQFSVQINSPAKLLGTIAAAAIVAGKQVRDTFLLIVNGYKNIWAAAKPIVTAIFEFVAGHVQQFILNFQMGVAAVIGFFGSLMTTIITTFQNMFAFVSTVAKGIWSVFKSVFTGVASLAEFVFSGLSKAFKFLFSPLIKVWGVIKNAAMRVIEGIIDALRPAIEWLGKLIPAYKDAFKELKQSFITERDKQVEKFKGSKLFEFDFNLFGGSNQEANRILDGINDAAANLGQGAEAATEPDVVGNFMAQTQPWIDHFKNVFSKDQKVSGPSALIDAFEKGSIEAAKQAYKNKEEMFAQKQLDATERMDQKLETQNSYFKQLVDQLTPA